MNLRRYNPFHPVVWALLFISFTAGFFAGGAYTGIAIRKNQENTCNFLLHR